MQVVNLSEHNSILNLYLRELRDVTIQKDSMRFRRNIERIGEMMAYEVSKHLHYATKQVQTPLGIASVDIPTDDIVLSTVLRAGLPLHQGFLNVFDHSESAFLSAFRRMGEDGKLEIVSEYLAAPSIEGKTLLLVDPMLATGQSMEVAYKALLSHGQPKDLHLCCVLGTPIAIEHLKKHLPETATLWCATIDEQLDEQKYIVPGLGDAGDLCFGEKL